MKDTETGRRGDATNILIFMKSIFETGFVWILLACAVYGAIHSVLAANGTKAWVKRVERRLRTA